MSTYLAGNFSHVTFTPLGDMLAGSRRGLDCGRSRSEPPRPCPPSRPSLTRRHSELKTDTVTGPSSLATVTENRGDDQQSSPRLTAPPSPAPTEVDDPEYQDLMEQLQRKGIKIRDFAFAPPYTSSHPFSDHEAPVTVTAHTTPTSIPAPTRTTEVFDPYKGLSEVDYRWAQTDRTFPIAGKTLRRLLDIRWLTVDELSTRGHAMDLAALHTFDAHRAAAKEANGGTEAFPWRPIIPEGEQPPTMDERQELRIDRARLWKQQDRMVVSKGELEEWRKRQNEEGAMKKKEFEELEQQRERERRRRGKRKMEEGADIDNQEDGSEDPAHSSCGPKRIRLSPSDDEEGVHTSTRRLVPPKKQYPAPLHAYKPELYPDAARTIQASSHLRASLPPEPSDPPARADTPPVDDRPQRLVHSRNRRALGRTMTLKEFF